MKLYALTLEKHAHRLLHLILRCSQFPGEFMYSTLRSSALGIFRVGDTKVCERIQEKWNVDIGGIEFQREFRDVKNSIGCSNWRKLECECVIEEH